MATHLATIPPPPLPRLATPWSLTPTDGEADAPRTGRTFVAAIDGEPIAQVDLGRVLRLRLRACYPAGAHDLALTLTPLTGHSDEPRLQDLLTLLVPALFTADPHCRRIVAAPREADDAAVRTFAAAEFRHVIDAELEDVCIVLLAAEPARITGLSTALDDMPH